MVGRPIVTTPVLLINNVQVLEGNPLVFNLTLTSASTQTIIVRLTTTDQTTTEGSDYNSADNQLVTFLAGQTVQLVTIGSNVDQFVESPETFVLSAVKDVTSVGNVLTSDTGIGTIIDPPSLNIVKEAAPDQTADIVGEKIIYNITVANTGGSTLTNVVVTDPTADGGITRNALDIVGDEDNLLEVGETWAFTATHTVTQAELDSNGGNNDGDIDNIATATSNEAAADSDDATVPLDQNPSLNIVKEAVAGQTADLAGETLTYNITVANTGNQTLTNVQVSDPFATGITRNALDIVGDEDNLLEVGETWSYTASHIVTQAELDSNGGGNGQLENTATATSTEAPTDSDDATVPLDQNPSLNIVKEAVAGQTADLAGETLTYNITVANTGNQTLTNVQVSDPFATGITRNALDIVGDEDNLLEVGETWSFTASHIVTQAEIDSNGGGNGLLENTATATSTEAPTDSDDATVPLDQNPSLNILKEAAAGQTADVAGETLTYNITVANTGNQTLTNVQVSDPFATGITRNALDIVGDEDNLLEVGETWSYTASHIVTQAELDSNGGGNGQLENTATATSTEAPTDSDDATVPVDQNPSLTIDKVADAGQTADVAGELITYTIKLVNTGSQTLTGVVVTDPNATGGGPNLVPSPGVTDDNELDAGETWTYTATHIVTQGEIDSNGGTNDGDLDNIATAVTAQTDPISDPATVPLLRNPALDIQKTAVAGQTADVVGETITYNITVANTGNTTLTGITVVDPNANAGITRNALDIVGDEDNDLEVGETWAFTATHTVTQAELDSNGGGDGDLDNIATANSNQTGPDSDPETVPLDQNLSLNIDKVGVVADGTADQVGDVINYTIKVTNLGNAEISNVVVKDDNGTPGNTADDVTLTLQSGDNGDGKLDVGETWTYTASHTLTQADFDAAGTDYTNVATATGTDTPTDSDPHTVPLDGTPTNGTANATVFEAGNERNPLVGLPLIFSEGTVEFANGGAVSGIEDALNVASNLSFGPDGPASAAARFDWNTSVTSVDGESLGAVALTSGGAPVSWVLAGGSNGETLNAVIQSGPNAGQIVATLTANFTGTGAATQVNFSYQQFGPFDHPDNSTTNPPNGQGGNNGDDPIRLTFNYTIQDSSGTTNSLGTFDVTVNDDKPLNSIVKVESVDSGATGTNLAFVVDVSNSTTFDTDPGPGVVTRFSVEVAALKQLLTQADAAGITGPVMISAFHGLSEVGNVAPRTENITFASVQAAIAGGFAAVDNFFNNLDGTLPTPPWSGFEGSTRWEGGLDAAAKWFNGTLGASENLPFLDLNGAITNPENVASSDNRLFFLTDGGNDNGRGGFTPQGGANDPQVDRLYTNVELLTNDIPNLTIRTVAILNGDANGAAVTGGPNGILDSIDFAGIVDQSDDNAVNGSATILTDAAGVAGIVAGFGTLVADNTATGNLLIDDDAIPGSLGADGLTPVIGADGFKTGAITLASFTYLSVANSPVTVVASGTFATFLGGSINVDFATGAYTYTGPTAAVTGTDVFNYTVLDGDNDVLPGVLSIDVGLTGSPAENAGFETDTLLFWKAAGTVWVADDRDADVPDSFDGNFAAVLHTGNTGANVELTPTADRTVYSQTDLQTFIGGGINLDTASGFDVVDGAVLKGTYDLALGAGVTSVDVTFDWQFLTDLADIDGGENEMAFVVVEGQLFVLANSDNQNPLMSPLDTVDQNVNVSVDGQAFTHATSYNQNQLLNAVTDLNGDGLINVAFGVVNLASGTASSAMLLVDDVQVTP